MYKIDIGADIIEEIDEKSDARIKRRRELEQAFGVTQNHKKLEKIPTIPTEPKELPKLKLVDYYPTVRELQYQNPSKKRGSGLPKEIADYLSKIKKLEKEDYRFDKNVVNFAVEISKVYLGKKLTAEEKQQFKFWTEGKLKKIARLTPGSDRPEKNKQVKTELREELREKLGLSPLEKEEKTEAQPIEQQKEIIGEMTAGDELQNLPPEYVQSLPSMEEVIKHQMDGYIATINDPALRNLLETIVSELGIETLKQYIEMGYLPMWVADSDAIMELKAAIDMYPPEIQKQINNVADLFDISYSFR